MESDGICVLCGGLVLTVGESEISVGREAGHCDFEGAVAESVYPSVGLLYDGLGFFGVVYISILYT
ncbi:MAG: hypothetical protein K2L26_02285, partial [Duncaniella sp.]|nr:hypothetical protein [Duncaniella sp.]